MRWKELRTLPCDEHKGSLYYVGQTAVEAIGSNTNSQSLVSQEQHGRPDCARNCGAGPGLCCLHRSHCGGVAPEPEMQAEWISLVETPPYPEHSPCASEGM